MSHWCLPYGKPTCSGLLKSAAEDFEVTEELGFTPDGNGEHLYLFVEKTGLGTHELIDSLSRLTGLPTRQIGYSGLKDKHALTRQWLSLHLPGTELDISVPADANYRILEQHRNSRKLRVGTHRFNRFNVILREVENWNEKSLRRLQQVSREGMANYFGEQRFGRKQDNVEQALAQLGGKRLSRQKRSLYLSALRSELFNQVLSSRISQGIWDHPLPGDSFMLRGSRSFFSAPVDNDIEERYRRLDISSCGSLYGAGDSPLSGESLELEEAVFDENPQIVSVLREQKVRRQMRPQRVAVEDLDYHYDQQQRLLVISCRLPAGSYFTSLLDHVITTRQVG